MRVKIFSKKESSRYFWISTTLHAFVKLNLCIVSRKYPLFSTFGTEFCSLYWSSLSPLHPTFSSHKCRAKCSHPEVPGFQPQACHFFNWATIMFHLALIMPVWIKSRFRHFVVTQSLITSSYSESSKVYYYAELKSRFILINLLINIFNLLLVTYMSLYRQHWFLSWHLLKLCLIFCIKIFLIRVQRKQTRAFFFPIFPSGINVAGGKRNDARRRCSQRGVVCASLTPLTSTGSRSLWGQTRGSCVWSLILVVFFSNPWLTSATSEATGMQFLATAEVMDGFCGTHGDTAQAAVSQGGWQRRHDGHAHGWPSSCRWPWIHRRGRLYQQKPTGTVCVLFVA